MSKTENNLMMYEADYWVFDNNIDNLLDVFNKIDDLKLDGYKVVSKDSEAFRVVVYFRALDDVSPGDSQNWQLNNVWQI